MPTTNVCKRRLSPEPPGRCSHCLGSGRAWDDSNEIPFLDADLEDGEFALLAIGVADAGLAFGVWLFAGWQAALRVSMCVFLCEMVVLIALRWRRSKNASPPLQLWQTEQSVDAHSLPRAVSFVRNNEPSSTASVVPPVTDEASPSSRHTPTPEGSASFALTLDWAAIEQRRRDTAEVHKLLSDTATPAAPNVSARAGAPVIGLESLYLEIPEQYLSFAKELCQRPSLPRHEYSSLARSHGVMPEAAMERINEVALAVLGDLLLLEENATVFLNPDLCNLPQGDR